MKISFETPKKQFLPSSFDLVGGQNHKQSTVHKNPRPTCNPTHLLASTAPIWLALLLRLARFLLPLEVCSLCVFRYTLPLSFTFNTLSIEH